VTTPYGNLEEHTPSMFRVNLEEACNSRVVPKIYYYVHSIICKSTICRPIVDITANWKYKYFNFVLGRRHI
jgi:hypothetical protein